MKFGIRSLTAPRDGKLDFQNPIPMPRCPMAVPFTGRERPIPAPSKARFHGRGEPLFRKRPQLARQIFCCGVFIEDAHWQSPRNESEMGHGRLRGRDEGHRRAGQGRRMMASEFYDFQRAEKIGKETNFRLDPDFRRPIRRSPFILKEIFQRIADQGIHSLSVKCGHDGPGRGGFKRRL